MMDGWVRDEWIDGRAVAWVVGGWLDGCRSAQKGGGTSGTGRSSPRFLLKMSSFVQSFSGRIASRSGAEKDGAEVAGKESGLSLSSGRCCDGLALQGLWRGQEVNGWGW